MNAHQKKPRLFCKIPPVVIFLSSFLFTPLLQAQTEEPPEEGHSPKEVAYHEEKPENKKYEQGEKKPAFLQSLRFP